MTIRIPGVSSPCASRNGCSVPAAMSSSRNGDGRAIRARPIATALTCTEKSHGDSKVFVIPVRFVMACKHGHVDEFPWDWWVGHKPDCTVSKRDNAERHPGLILRSEKPGLAGLILSCPKCGARRSMDGVFSKKTWERGPKCRGHDHGWPMAMKPAARSSTRCSEVRPTCTLR